MFGPCSALAARGKAFHRRRRRNSDSGLSAQRQVSRIKAGLRPGRTLPGGDQRSGTSTREGESRMQSKLTARLGWIGAFLLAAGTQALASPVLYGNFIGPDVSYL